MSILQEQAVQMISGLSDDNTSESVWALQRLNAARGEIRKYLPVDFDPDRELEEARPERYGGVGASYVVTRNVTDFMSSTVPAITPEDLLKEIEKKG